MRLLKHYSGLTMAGGETIGETSRFGSFISGYVPNYNIFQRSVSYHRYLRIDFSATLLHTIGYCHTLRQEG
jgi:hypothetical protein